MNRLVPLVGGDILQRGSRLEEETRLLLMKPTCRVGLSILDYYLPCGHLGLHNGDHQQLIPSLCRYGCNNPLIYSGKPIIDTKFVYDTNSDERISIVETVSSQAAKQRITPQSDHYNNNAARPARMAPLPT